MRGAHRYAKTCRPFCDRWVTNGRNEETFLLERIGQVERSVFMTDYPRDDRGAGFAKGTVALREHLAKLQNSPPKGLAARFPLRGRQETDRSRRRSGQCRRRLVRKDERTRAIDQPIDQITRAANVATAHA